MESQPAQPLSTHEALVELIEIWRWPRRSAGSGGSSPTSPWPDRS